MRSRGYVVTVGVPVGLATLGVVETLANSSLAGDRAVTGVAVVLLAGCALVRGRAPVAAAVVAGVVLASSAVAGGHAHDESFVAVVCELMLSGSVASSRERGLASRGFAGLLGGLLLAIAVRGDASDALLGSIVLGSAFAAGRVVHQLRARTAALAAVSAQLAAERDRAAADGALAERARIARDLHDVVAHHVSVMVVQAGGARGVLHDDLASAERALLTVERTGREALMEMRRLLGVLRDEDAPRKPQPRWQDAAQLLSPEDRWRVEGEPAALDDGRNLMAYRLLQEALTNVRRHGSGGADIRLSWLPDRLEVVVDNDVAGGRTSGHLGHLGHGRRGMAERAALYGGTVTAAPRGDTGWRVRAVLPLGPRPLDPRQVDA